MPTYDYECPECGVFEVFQSMSESPLKKCPTCESKVKRLIGGGLGVIFKGNGFYVTDNKGAKNGAAPKGEKSSKNSKSNSKETA